MYSTLTQPAVDIGWTKIERLLHLACTQFGMEVALLTEFDAGMQIVRAASGDIAAWGMSLDTGTPMAASYCERVLDGILPNVINDAHRHPITRELPVTQLANIGSYVGVPWRGADGEPVGMLCCLSRHPAPDLGEQSVRFLSLIAELISDHVASPIAAHRARTEAQEIREIIASRAVRMVFQPVVRLIGNKIRGYEALARFSSESFPTPVQAFAAADRAGLGVELEHLAVQCAFERLDDVPPGVWLSVNLSVPALLSPPVVATLLEYADRGIAVEVTEHTEVADYGALLEVTERLRDAGVRIAVDDAGAGFASLSHILQLRPDIIKLDITLTRNIDVDQVRMALARSLVGFARDIGALLIAEGVETSAEHEKLQSLGVQLGQGYFMAKPAPLAICDTPTRSRSSVRAFELSHQNYW